MATPDFLGIGAQKAGTSWLAANLQKHPEIWIPPFKEIHYFDEMEVNPGIGFPELFDHNLPYPNLRYLRVSQLLKTRWPEVMADGETAKWCLKWLLQKRSDEWYFSLFDFPHHAKIAGEITPEYCLLPERTVAAIKSMNPEMKIFFAIRNPIYRCWSQVSMELDLFGSVTFSEAGEQDIVNHLRSENVVGRNDYVGLVRKWKKYFSDDHFRMLFFDDIVSDPSTLMHELCGFLGVSPFPDALSAELAQKVNAGPHEDFPLKYKRLIAELTIGHIRDCAETFGGSCVAWLDEAEAILGQRSAPCLNG